MTSLIELSKHLPELAVIVAVSGFFGWCICKLVSKPASEKATAAKPPATAEKTRLDRVKNLESSLEKSKSAQKSLKAEFEELQNKSVPISELESSVAELAAARKSLEAESKRISTLETDFRKSQETIKHLNARSNDADKSQKDRSFALENELSKVREQLAVFQNTPDASKDLQAEIERLRESVAVSTRYAGEVRKREAVANESLEKAEARLADLSDPARLTSIARKIGPVGDSGRIAAAKAEVVRLVEMNKQKEATAALLEEPAPVVIAEEISATVAATPEVKKAPSANEQLVFE